MHACVTGGRVPRAWMRFAESRASQPCVRYGLAIFLFRVFGPPATLPGSKMTMMKKKMATNLAPATATLKPETRMENMEILLYLIQMGDTGEALKYSARMPRHLQPSAPSVIEHKKPRRKRRLRSVGFTTLQRRESAKAIFRQSCIHDQVTYNKLCPRCVYPATVMGPR